MKDIAISTETGQMIVNKGDLQMVTQIDQMKQRIWFILSLQKGEFSLEPDAGFDMFAILGHDVTKIDLQNMFRNTIMSQYDDVADVVVVSKDMDVKERRLSIELEITAVDGLKFKTEGTIDA